MSYHGRGVCTERYDFFTAWRCGCYWASGRPWLMKSRTVLEGRDSSRWKRPPQKGESSFFLLPKRGEGSSQFVCVPRARGSGSLSQVSASLVRAKNFFVPPV